MATLQEIVDRALDIAAGAIDGPLQNADMLAQSLLGEALHEVTERSVLNPYYHQVFKKVISLTLTDNAGELPDEALTAYICTAEVQDVNGDFASYSPYHTFLRLPDPRLAHFTIKQGVELHYLPVGGGAYNDDIEVVMPCVPLIPALATDEVVMPAEMVDEVARTLANKIVAAYKGALV